MSALSMALYATAAVVASWLVVGAMLRLLTAAQCLVLPGSMRHQRGRFDAGMDTLLSLQSLGTLTPAERKKLADAKVLTVSPFAPLSLENLTRDSSARKL